MCIYTYIYIYMAVSIFVCLFVVQVRHPQVQPSFMKVKKRQRIQIIPIPSSYCQQGSWRSRTKLYQAPMLQE